MSEARSAPTGDPGTPGGTARRWAPFRSWSRLARRLTVLGVVAVVLLCLALVTSLVLAFRPLPQTSGTVEVPGLEGDVEVVRDERGVPQIYADSLEDLMLAQGYVHAQERFYEMDVRRHTTAGRLAELFGEPALASDKMVRTLGWRRVAERELPRLEPETRQALQAYADGVNAYLDGHDTSAIAVEYTLLRLGGLDYDPEPWTPVDSLAWLKAMAWELRGNMQQEIQRVLAQVDLPEGRARQLWPGYPYDRHSPIVTGGAVVDGEFEPEATSGGSRLPHRPAYGSGQVTALRQAARATRAVPELLGRGSGIGSNSWVVDGEHSATGSPILANDPHLSTSVPGPWMQVGLHCREITDSCPIDVAGASFSGVPGVMIGHNREIAWGFTNLAPDVTDLYLEQVRGRRWRYDGEYRPLQIRTETIEVRDGEDFELTVRETGHGPLISDVSPELSSVGANATARREPPGGRGNGYAVALKWTALQPTTTADAILALNKASDWEEFRAAARDFAVPAQNLVYADRRGHIGYQATGTVPIRTSGNDGRLPSEGWLPENDWTGDEVPFDALPRARNPEDGMLVTANQAVIADDYRYFLGDDWAQGYRSHRIKALLEAEGRLSVGEMAQIQTDSRHPFAPELVPYLLDIRLDRGYQRGGQRLLRQWDFRQGADSAAAAYFNAVWDALLEKTFHDELRPALHPDGSDRWYAVVARLLRDPVDPFWDDVTTENEVESRDDILRAALVEARDELTRRRSRDPQEWTWGHVHELDLVHQTLGSSGNPLVEWVVNRTGRPARGGSAAVDATSWDAAEGFSVTAAPSMRMVMSLDDLDQSRWITLTGVSGHPASDHYVDQTQAWLAGRTDPWPFSRDAVEQAAAETLTLRPGDEEGSTGPPE